MEKQLEKRLNGDPSKIDPDVPMEYQTEFLPYDRKWEFPRKRLRLGLLFFGIVHLINGKYNYKFNLKVKNWDPVVSVESSEPRPWASKALKKQ